MNKVLFLSFCFLICTNIAFAQTWTIRNDERKCDYEYTVITKDQFQRLLRQYEASSQYCVMNYVDVLERRNEGKIISGQRPNFNGYYYILIKIKPHLDKLTQEERSALNLVNMTNGIIYGNSDTGELQLVFTSMYGMLLPNAYEIDTNEYKTKYNQFIGFVNGE